MGACQSSAGGPPAIQEFLVEVETSNEWNDESDVKKVAQMIVDSEALGSSIREIIREEQRALEEEAERVRIHDEAMREAQRQEMERVAESDRLECARIEEAEREMVAERARIEAEEKASAQRAKDEEAVRKKQQEIERRKSALANRPPPTAAIEILKMPGGKMTRHFMKWQSRLLVIEKGVLYYYEKGTKGLKEPFGENIKGFIGLRNMKVYTDLDDMDPEVILLRKNEEGGEIKGECVCSGTSSYLLQAGEAQSNDLVIKPFMQVMKMDYVNQLEQHIKYANRMNVLTPAPEDDERTRPLVGKKSFFSLLPSSRFSNGKKESHVSANEKKDDKDKKKKEVEGDKAVANDV